ncbi:MAG TPA: tripartite tricarboxylate transporter substrate binding protein [Burkholderiales bacterium]
MIARIACCSALLLAALPLYVSAQDAYPNRPVSVVVPFPPGGMADLSARPLASSMEQVLKQPVVILNKPGASGAVGIQSVANARPDGYTIMVTLVSFLTIPEVDEMFGRKPAYTRDQFVPLALLAADPPVLAVSAASPWKSVKELVDDAKKRPGEIVYSHSGLYGPSHVPMEIFLHAANIKMRQLPAVGGGPAMTLVLGGNAGMWASPPAMAAPHVQSQKMRVLASWGASRHPAFADVPTLKELGYDAEFYVWSGVFAPKGTPEPTVSKLRDAIRKAVAFPEFKTAMAKVQTPINYLDGPEFQEFLEKDSRMLAGAIKTIGRIEPRK